MTRIPGRSQSLLGNVDPRRYRPVPTSTERLVQIAASADASISSVPLIGPSAKVGTDFIVRAGRVGGPHGAASVFEIEGSIAAGLHARFLGDVGWKASTGSDNSGLPALRIQIPDERADGGRWGQMIVTSTMASGATVEQMTSSVDLSKLVGMDLAAKTRLAIEKLSANDPGGALRALADIRLPDGAVETSVATFSGRDTSVGVGAEAGEGISVGADLDGGFQRLFRTG